MTALDDRVRHEAIERARAASDETGLLLDAAELVIASGLGSRRMIHRKLRIGWDKAGTLLDRLEAAGVIGPDVGDPRDVLVAPEGLDAALEALAAEARPPGLVKPGARSPAGDKAGEEAGDAPADPGDNPGDAPARPGDDPGDRAGAPAGDTRGPHPGDEVSPARPGGTLVKRQVDDVARLIDDPGDDPGDDTSGQPRQLLVARVIAGGAQVVTTLRQSERPPFRYTRVVVRYGWVVGQGIGSWCTRASRASTQGNNREQVAMARRAGLPDEMERKDVLLDKLRNSRVHRLKDIPAAIKGVAIGIGVTAMIVPTVLLILGILSAIASHGFGEVLGFDWTYATGWNLWWGFIGWVGLIISALLPMSAALAISLIPVVFVRAAHAEGKKVKDPPRWLLTRDELHSLNAEVTPDSITAAMANMKIAALTRALKEGAMLEFIVQPREQGGGTYFQLRLPIGCMAADFLPSSKVELLAANLARHKHETWPQRQPEQDARVLDCWIADKGTMDQPAPAWPLLHEGEFDVFRDRAPLGVTMRREPVAVGMLQKHWLIGASSKQGKSTFLRLVLLTLALDPTVELRVSDLKGDGDLRCLKERCHTYIEGATDEDAEATCIMLEDLVVEMKRRYADKARLNITGNIPRALSRRKGSGFHPIFAVADECQVMYMAGKAADGTLVGGSKDDSRAQKAAKRLEDQARAVNIHLHQATQRPDPQTMPVRVREGVHVRVCMWVPKLSAAQMILAEAADQGARPYDLRPGVDAGTAVFAGEVEDIPVGQAFTIVKTYYVDEVQAARVADRAIEAWRKYGRSTSPLVIEAGDDPAAPDSLVHIIEAMRGEDKVLTRDVLYRLKEDRVDTYGDWGHRDLADALKEYELYGVRIRRTNGDSKVFLEDLHRAHRERSNDLH